MKVSDASFPPYPLPFLIPRGLAEALIGNCPAGQEPNVFLHDAKIAQCYLLFGYLEGSQTHVGQLIRVIKHLWQALFSIFPAPWGLLSNLCY